jgi:hypothetical protein
MRRCIRGVYEPFAVPQGQRNGGVYAPNPKALQQTKAKAKREEEEEGEDGEATNKLNKCGLV